ncbi:hypothetical protein [Leptospira phage LE3]|uniref:Uncharacterized protein n=2 Tax=Nylescharonvirus TaxID=2843431 RepID=A0A343LEB1_9CAUD|nr:hypothetical protein HWB33_gp10 [Leptospira phage LE3]YP_009835483.1 hypothetical protein HWB34_gp08 [Leptospira phage LE4]ATN94984.1 hypothetical protein [Leptospira phage LE3]ATN95021.1 hypothetical protein [Leptospira phage LE4]
MKVNQKVESIHGIGIVIGFESTKSKRAIVQITEKNSNAKIDWALHPTDILFYFKKELKILDQKGEN